MEDTVISVHNISKMYPLYADPRDRLKQSLWYALPEFLRGQPRQFYQEFWALHHLSFDIGQGETVGIIGRNGSGKSTLLQIIAGTLTPTQGEVQIKGRVAALLELGSGFNLEFTGRENVYLNGSIWGMKKEEIDLIFDDIVAFADIGPFIDQPVKVYSSGMFVRLAFAVQAFVPKEVFIVDEALSVGDEAFQRKCIRRLEKFREDGGTILLVSHNMQTIVRQCQRCLLLHQGQLIADDDSKPVTDLYQKLMYSDPQQLGAILSVLREQGLSQALLHSQAKAASSHSSESRKLNKIQNSERPTPDETEPRDWFDPYIPEPEGAIYGNGQVRVTEYGMYNQQDERVNILIAGRTYRWAYVVQFEEDAYNVHFGLMLKTIDGLDVAGVASFHHQPKIKYIPAHSVLEVSFWIKLNVVPGTYFLNVGIGGDVDDEPTYLQRHVDICMIKVLPRDERETHGIAYLDPEFSYRQLS